jgi:hypothetical protein
VCGRKTAWGQIYCNECTHTRCPVHQMAGGTHRVVAAGAGADSALSAFPMLTRGSPLPSGGNEGCLSSTCAFACMDSTHSDQLCARCRRRPAYGSWRRAPSERERRPAKSATRAHAVAKATNGHCRVCVALRWQILATDLQLVGNHASLLAEHIELSHVHEIEDAGANM